MPYTFRTLAARQLLLAASRLLLAELKHAPVGLRRTRLAPGARSFLGASWPCLHGVDVKIDEILQGIDDEGVRIAIRQRAFRPYLEPPKTPETLRKTAESGRKRGRKADLHLAPQAPQHLGRPLEELGLVPGAMPHSEDALGHLRVACASQETSTI